MAAEHVEEPIKPEVAGHIVEAMGAPTLPPPATLAVSMGITQGQQWPDGSGKNRHPRDRATSHGRAGQQAAVTAVHRTGRPQMPHSS